ncbi:MAG: phospholipase D-like domain-containing protein [Sulfurimonas sp.]|uniref:phospholipase D-like domain-containing protein n=1 Tax=Sulfurimonas sp. TaxID=2022749 RepID=UPI00260BFBB7|nr:phospholipase D-like domain-containing protein [Sulfurimonas sp.]MDD5372142.1 phospholipase D-like domain-containing protein [Sulfurimonas sp.]
MNEQINSNLTDIFFYYSLVIFGALLTLLVLIHMLYHRRTPNSIIAWLLSIVLVPYISMPLYFIIGSRKRKNRYKKSNLILKNQTTDNNIQNGIDRVLRNYGIADASKNREFKLFFDAAQTYNELLNCIDGAKKSIYISVYVFEYDKVTKEILNALVKKAQEGIEIKILIDSLGSINIYLLQYRLKGLRDAGGRVEFFMPLFEMPFRNYINLRNHRKIYIFDDEKVLSGGANLSHEYLGEAYGKKKWEDIMFLIEGCSVEQFFEIFASDWFYASGEKLEFKRYNKEIEGNIFLQVIPSGPDMDKDTLYEVLLSAIYGAKEKIYIITPYFIPNNALIQALIIAHHKGVDVKLITPRETNHIIVNLVRSSYMRELEEAGIKIYLYDGSMLHAKAILFDNSCVVLGSVNFDNRSLFLNYEVATFVYSAKVIKEIDKWTKVLISNSSFGTKRVSGMKRVFENMMRILAPQL